MAFSKERLPWFVSGKMLRADNGKGCAGALVDVSVSCGNGQDVGTGSVGGCLVDANGAYSGTVDLPADVRFISAAQATVQGAKAGDITGGGVLNGLQGRAIGLTDLTASTPERTASFVVSGTARSHKVVNTETPSGWINLDQLGFVANQLINLLVGIKPLAGVTYFVSANGTTDGGGGFTFTVAGKSWWYQESLIYANVLLVGLTGLQNPLATYEVESNQVVADGGAVSMPGLLVELAKTTSAHVPLVANFTVTPRMATGLGDITLTATLTDTTPGTITKRKWEWRRSNGFLDDLFNAQNPWNLMGGGAASFAQVFTLLLPFDTDKFDVRLTVDDGFGPVQKTLIGILYISGLSTVSGSFSLVRDAAGLLKAGTYDLVEQ